MQRKKHSAEFKAKIALEALKNLRTINEIASEAQVHPTQVNHQPLFISNNLRQEISTRIPLTCFNLANFYLNFYSFLS